MFKVNILSRTISIVTVFVLALSGVQPVFAAAPSNDAFSSPTIIGTLPFSDSVDITDATAETGEPQICAFLDKSAWYSFTPLETMLVRTDIQGSFDNSILNVYRANGSEINNLSFQTCIGNSSSYTFLAIGGQTYYLQVGTIMGIVGTIHVNFEQIPPPGNDNFASATNIGSLSFVTNFDFSGATFESDEPFPSCVFTSPPYPTIWYAFSPSQDADISAWMGNSSASPFLAIYTGTNFNNLAGLGCGQSGNTLTFHAIAGQLYYFQIGSFFEEMGGGTFQLEITPPPVANFFFYPSDSSIFDIVQFCDNSFDPGGIGIQSLTWYFGDGATSTDNCAQHQFSTDGDFTVQHSVKTFDGRTASTSQVVHVRTKDIAITTFSIPQTARVNQTKTINVNIQNKRYSDYVQVILSKGLPGGGEQQIGVLTIYVPAKAKQATTFKFSYTFTTDDANVGKVTFKAVANLVSGRDALPADNTSIATTIVSK